jgi:hypothetical protein
MPSASISSPWLKVAVGLVALLLAARAPAAQRPASVATTCNAWLTKTLKAADRLPEQKWRDWIIASLARSCSAIPEGIREASVRFRASKDSRQRAQMLADASQAVLGPRCLVGDPFQDAQALAAACPLPDRPEFKLKAEALEDIQAVDYAVVNAVVRSLLDAGEYSKGGERLFLYFTLSATLRGEEARGRKRAGNR